MSKRGSVRKASKGTLETATEFSSAGKVAAASSTIENIEPSSDKVKDDPDSPLATTEVADSGSNLSVESMKKGLGLDNLKCGHPKDRTDDPCNWKLASPMKKVDSQIEKMIHLDLVSRDFEPELRILIGLTNCKHHRRPKDYTRRMKDWKKVFLAEGEHLAWDERIKEVLGRAPTKCCGINLKGKRCGNDMGGQKVQHANKTIAEIIKPEVFLDKDDREYALEVLIACTFCRYHTNQSKDKLTLWKSSLEEICDQFQIPETKEQARSQTESRVARSRREGTPPAECWPDTRDTSPLISQIAPSRPFHKEDAYRLIKEALLSDFDQVEQEDGCVYAYQVDGNKDFVKIGYTAQAIEERLEKWDFACNRASARVYPANEESMQIPFAKRVEALCHAELQYRSEYIDCSACDVQHQEWFRVSVDEASMVIKKWTAWVKTKPYQPRTLEKNECHAGWYLSDEIQQKTENMLVFMEMIGKLVL
jgi:hypothetical protein